MASSAPNPKIAYNPSTLQIKPEDWQMTLSQLRQDFSKEKLDQPFYPSDKILCLLSKKAYQDDIIDLPENWKLIATARNIQDGYFGAVFCNEEYHQLVISHRGTKDLKAVKADLEAVVFNKYSNQIHSAGTFAYFILNEFSENNYSTSFTGHSLGGYLAQNAAYLIEYLKVNDGYFCRATKSERRFHCHTVTFDSPGSYDMLLKLSKDYFHRYENKPETLLPALDITTYFLAPNIINTANKHVGTLYRLDAVRDNSNVNPSGKVIKRLMEKLAPHTIYYHSIDNFIRAFENENVPVLKILDWPVNKPKNVFSFRKELNEFFKYGTEENEYKPDIDHLNICSINVHYKKEFDDGTCVNMNAFTEKEWGFLQNSEKLKSNQISPVEIISFLETMQLGIKYESLFPNFKFIKDEKMEGIKCDSTEEADSLFNRTKRLFADYPEIHDIMRKQIAKTPKIYEALYLATSRGYLNSLPKCDATFRDTINLEGFLKSEEQSVLLLMSPLDLKYEMLRIVSIIQQIEEERLSATFLSWRDVEYLERFVDMAEAFASPIVSSRIGKTLVIELDGDDFKDEKISFILKFKKKISEEKKLILIIPNKSAVADYCTNISDELFLKKDIKGLSFEDLTLESQKNVLINNQAALNNNKHFSQIFFSLSCSNVTEKIAITKLSNVLAKISNAYVSSNRDSVTFFITGDIDIIIDELQCIDSDQIEHCENNDRKEQQKFFQKLCLDNLDKNIFWFHVLDNDWVLWQQVFDFRLYIERQFQTRMILDAKKFEEQVFVKTTNSFFIFIVRDSKTLAQNLCIDEDILTQHISRGKFHLVATEAEGLSLLEEKSKLQETAHVIEAVGRKLFWKRSNGSIGKIRYFLDPYKFESIKETDLLLKNEKVTLVADGSGSGKSTVLLKLAKCASYENSWVFWIDLKNIYQHLNILSNLNSASTAEFLLKHDQNVSESQFKLVHALLKFDLENENSKAVTIFFDGFDEIQEVNEIEKKSIQNRVILLFKYLKERTSAKIWITTRNQYRDLLEDELFSFAIKLKEMSYEEQEQFCERFWLPKISIEISEFNPENKSALKNYTKELLQTLNRILNQKTSSFMELPLQLRMIAETLQPNAEILNASLEEIPIIYKSNIPMGNLYDLYTKYIDRKYDIYFKEKLCFQPLLTHVEYLRDDFKKIHEALAINHLLPRLMEKLGNEVITELGVEKKSDLNRIGLVEINDCGKVLFVHRTFAEYFTAEKLFDLIQTLPQGPAREFLCNYTQCVIFLRKDEYFIILQFLNDRLDSKKSKFSNLDFIFPPDMDPELQKLILNSIIVKGLGNIYDSIFKYADECPDYFLPSIVNVKIGPNGEPQLHIAAIVGESGIISTLLNYGADINELDKSLRTPLAWACEAPPGRENIVRDLIAKGAQVNAITSPLFWACQVGYWHIANLLIENGTFIDQAVMFKINDRLQDKGEKDVISNFFEKAVSINAVDKNGYPPLFLALYNELWELAWLLIEKGAEKEKVILKCLKKKPDLLQKVQKAGKKDLALEIIKVIPDNNVVNEKKETPLLCDAAKMDTDIASKLLLEKVADTNTSTKERVSVPHEADANIFNSKKQTPLFLAVKPNQLDKTKGANINATNSLNETPLPWAVIHKNWDVARSLIQNGADIAITCENGDTLLHITVSVGEKRNISMLVHIIRTKKDFASFNWYFFFTGVVQAGKWKKAPVSDFSRAYYISFAIQCLESSQYEPEHNGEKEFTSFLLNNGAEVNATNSFSETSLFCAVMHKNLDIAELLIENGADIQIPDQNDNTVLHLTAAFGNTEFALKLLKKGADVNIVNNSKETPLFWAVINKKWDLAQLLIENGADTNISNENNETVLHLTAAFGEIQFVLKLLDKGANVNAKTLKTELYPLDFAIKSGNWDVALLLLDKASHEIPYHKFLLEVLCFPGECENENLILKLKEKC